MTDEQNATESGTGAPPPGGPTTPRPEPDFGDRMKAFGDEIGARGQALGREAEAAANRWSTDPRVTRTVGTATRVWGLILVLVGFWFLADVTFGYRLPLIPWRDLWPAALVVVGLFIIARGMTRRA